MKFQGEAVSAQATGKVCLPRPGSKFLEFEVRACGLGDEAKGERIFPDVKPPTDFVYDKKGTMVRDPKTDRPMRETNYMDPSFIQKQEAASRMQMVVQVVDALGQDARVTWETDKAVGSKEFYEACFEEMKASGITLGDMEIIRQKVRVLGNLDGKALEAAADSFSPPGE